MARPEFTEIGDMFRVNFYRRQDASVGDKSAINAESVNIPAINFKERILEFLAEHDEARSQDIATYIGLKVSRTRDYLSELVEDGKITPNGANKNRTYSLKT